MSSYRRYIVARGVLIGFFRVFPCGFMWAYKGRQGLLIVIGNFCCKTVPLHRYPAKARYFFALPPVFRYKKGGQHIAAARGSIVHRLPVLPLPVLR